MRALVLGTAGVSKLEFLQTVRRIACKENVKPGGEKSALADKFLILRDVDKELEKEKGGYAQYGVYLSETDQDEQEAEWARVAKQTVGEINQADPKHAFLLLHAVYFRNKTFRSMLDMSILSEFHPSVILVLIEDAYDVVARIDRKEKAAGTGSRCSLSEAIEWRTVEMMVANMLSRNLLAGERIPLFVVARKHSPEMAYRLLFERWRLVVYSAFPITSVRYKNAAIKEINEFRSTLSHEFTVFDPATIDEFPITVTKRPKIKRWPGLTSDVDGVKGVTVREFLALEEDIRKTIELRDFQLVDQSDCLVAYRPFYGGRQTPSAGVDREMAQCLSRKKPIFVVHDEQKDGQLTSGKQMFKPIARATATKPNVAELLPQLRLTQEEKRKRWEIDGRPSTWESPVEEAKP